MDIVDKSRSDRADSKAQRGQWDEPARAHPFAEHVGGDFEDDVGDIEDG